ncbi:hypothetical protein DRE_07373 [Drechslerella stenobrocha 248]|uniref:Uncharacterized protein n=1 Tax=Drechslerella stenobrocha 248 TaxID=1043628 RepID=W7I4U1_9PEZI|nr:hypothetical protein DRE_07373 [Drechslerella stenobrocha 248]
MPALLSNAIPNPPSTDTFNLTLTKAVEGATPAFLPLNIQFSYDWDFSRNMGSATVLGIGSNNTLKYTMFPMGVSGVLAFMARDQFPVTIQASEGKEELFAYRVLMNMNKVTAEDRKAAVMLGEEGNIVIATENWGSTEVL